ncbi:MAG: hypothetical protein KDC75_26715, partial [Phaeodactylibacter sp.]|nr:hypothetical protein [Phaeodactylibacter sp.]
DGNPNTIDDVIDANCNCAGTPVACPGIGDADGDGLCADVDCDDQDPQIDYRPGDACDDGDPTTRGETIQDDCKCGGGAKAPARTSARISTSEDDAEERASGAVDLTSSDLELAEDPNQGKQAVGLRFTTLNLPQGVVISRAYVQFTVDETSSGAPCDLDIYGLASDNTPAFTGADNDISYRTRTKASVAWAPKDWEGVGDAKEAQQTPDISTIIQDIVNRPSYTANSSIGLLIEGIG